MPGQPVRPDIRVERVRRGLTLPAFAEAVGITYDVARRAEQGLGIREGHAKALGDYLGVDPVLFVREPNEPTEKAA